MKKLIASLAAALLWAPLSFAATIGPTAPYSKYGPAVLSGSTLDVSPRTFSVSQDRPDYSGMYQLMTLWVCVTDANDSVTDFDIACTGSHNSGTTDYTLQSCSTLIAGSCESVAASHSKNDIESLTAADTKCFPWRYDVWGIPEIECSITNTGGAAADSVAVVITFCN